MPVTVPEDPKLDISDYSRVLVAGFVTRTNQSVDLDTETVRLLRSQLKHESDLHIVEAHLRPLGDFSDSTLESDGRWYDFERMQAETEQTRESISREEWIEFEQEKILNDVDYWRAVGEEYQEPLILAGQLTMIEEVESSFVSGTREPQRFRKERPEPLTLEARTRHKLNAVFYFIDGRTGGVIHRERLMEEVLYSADERPAALFSYFELMERMLPQVLLVLSPQEITTTRILLE